MSTARKSPNHPLANYWHPIEDEWMQKCGEQWSPLSAVAASVHELVALIAQDKSFVERSPSPAVRVQRLLIRRLGEELRGIEVLAERGHGLQAISMAANFFEQAYRLIAASVNDTQAKKYLEHEDMKNSFINARDAVLAAGKLIGWDKARCDAEYETYNLLCLFKHNHAKIYNLGVVREDIDLFLGRLSLSTCILCALQSVGMLGMIALQGSSLQIAIQKCVELMGLTKPLIPGLPPEIEVAIAEQRIQHAEASEALRIRCILLCTPINGRD
jgi:hypothetical protein